MKTNNKRAATVGIFILFGVAIFIAGILTLGGQKKTFEKNHSQFKKAWYPQCCKKKYHATVAGNRHP